ncbi:MAG TPA: aconitate hydratase AcnA [Herpetosiphonaceae bacterium]|nr:aconitate hydratase AcnA [Herpetosiphonaceae bacterium]
MNDTLQDPLAVCDVLRVDTEDYTIWSLPRLAARYQVNLSSLPYVARLLLESTLRALSAGLIREEVVEAAMRELCEGQSRTVIPYLPGRVLVQDFTGVPVLVDLAAMREAIAELGGNPARVNPVVPTDVIVDHSIIADVAGRPDALTLNTTLEFQRNHERYRLLRWAEQAFPGVRVMPPGTGIVHQINLEHLASVVQVQPRYGRQIAFPDSVCGTDSHTTMINGLGVLGWGVGGIEAEAAMLGQPLMLLCPSVVGVRLVGQLRPGVTTTDLVLTITERLRQECVVGAFVEFYGPGVGTLSLPDRATVANMAPEYGATCAYFPVDQAVLDYLRATDRPEALVRLVEAYYQAQGLLCADQGQTLEFQRQITVDLALVQPCLAGPRRPQDRVTLGRLKSTVDALLEDRGPAPDPVIVRREDGQDGALAHGSVLIAAITSCTNTSNPAVMIAAGLLARNAVARGLRTPWYVKTSLSPGSQVVSDYLEAAGLMPPLEQLGFHVTGYGCMTCSGSSGPLSPAITTAVREQGLIGCAVLSGNRNFEARIHPLVRANYLASPPLVIAYALAGTMAIDLEREALGMAPDGEAVYLRDIWPADHEIEAVMRRTIVPALFSRRYAGRPASSAQWDAIPRPQGALYRWEDASTYIRRPPYFAGLSQTPPAFAPIAGGRVLALLGDSITTDHISPGGAIDPQSPAGQYLREQGVAPAEFNAYGARRGNHEVMIRGTFANPRLANMLVPGVEGGVTRHHPSGTIMAIYDAALRYGASQTPLLILAGKDYGAGSSRDWAAKGPALLGVRIVIAESFERIHRSNLICMGILPLEFMAGESWGALGLDGSEIYTMSALDSLAPGHILMVTAVAASGTRTEFFARARLDSEHELRCYRHGGILPQLMRDLLADGQPTEAGSSTP